MPARFAFAAMVREDVAVVEQAVRGLPGLAAVPKLGRFATWTQANARAMRLNEGLGHSMSESRDIVTDAMLIAERLIRGCRALRKETEELRHRLAKTSVPLEFVLTELELGVTLCHSVCLIPPAPDVLERLLRSARRALSNAIAAMVECEFDEEGIHRVTVGVERLQEALEDCQHKEDSVVEENASRTLIS